MGDRRLEGLVRLIDKRKAGDKGSADSMIDLGEVSDVSGSAGEVPTCTVDGDDADVFEPYGLAGQAASGDALVFAPGGDVDSLTVLVSSVAGRPATQPGDKALWTAAGHVIYLDDDGGLTITSKDGAVIELPDTGGVVVTAASLAGITLVVDGGQIKLGDDTATLGVARQTDPVGPSLAMGAWATMIEAAIVGAGGVIPPGTNFAATVASSFASITGASTTTLSK
jgi:hypothetical protein